MSTEKNNVVHRQVNFPHSNHLRNRIHRYNDINHIDWILFVRLDEMGNKRPLSSERNCEEIEYLIRDELVRKRPNMHIPNGKSNRYSKYV